MYDFSKIEQIQIEKAEKGRFYKVEKNYLKEQYFLYTAYPVSSNESLSIEDARRIVYADFIARFKRLNDQNVLFSLGYNDIDSSILTNISNKIGKSPVDFVSTNVKMQRKTIKLFQVGFDLDKEIKLSNEEYVSFVQQFFKILDENNLIDIKEKMVYAEDSIYQYFDYKIGKDGAFSYDGKLLIPMKKKVCTLSIAEIKDELINETESLNVSSKIKEDLYKRIGQRKGTKITLMTNVGNYLTLSMEKIEHICGVSFVCLNPKYIDIKPYIAEEEKEAIAEELASFSNKTIYSGTYLINVVNSNYIPIMISDYYEEAIHLGIPSISDYDEEYANSFDLPYNPIFDFVGDVKVLVNSGYLNGYTENEAHEILTKKLFADGLAEEFDYIETDDIILSSNCRFGIPIPLLKDKKITDIPVVYDLNHDVKTYNNEVVDKFLIKDFFCDSFVKAVLISAIRLIHDGEITNIFADEVDSDLADFNEINYYLCSEKELSEVIWVLIINALLKKYWKKSLALKINNLGLLGEIYDTNQKVIKKENNNLFDINKYLYENGSSSIRLLFANNNEDCVFSQEEIEKSYEILERIVRVFYNRIDDRCDELNNDYKLLCFKTKELLNDEKYAECLAEILLFIKKVNEIKHLSRLQCKGLLTIISVFLPMVAEQIKDDVLNIKEPICYLSWPE